MRKPTTLQRPIITSLGIGLALICYGAVPALFDHGHVVDDLIYGSAMRIAIPLALFAVILILGIAGMQRRATNGHSPWGFYWGMVGAWFILGMSLILLVFGRDYKLAVDLTAHGVPAEAHLVRQFIDGCGRHSCSTELEYSFVPNSRTEPVNGFVNVGDISRHQNAVYRYAMSAGRIPILYDPIDPSQSMVYWNNQIARQASPKFILKEMTIFSVFLLIAIALFGGILWQAARALSVERAPEQGRR